MRGWDGEGRGAAGLGWCRVKEGRGEGGGDVGIQHRLWWGGVAWETLSSKGEEVGGWGW